MGVLQLQEVGSTSTIKNANWEVILTDPSLSKFNFGMPISDKYIMTDIISPLGQKSILYNTVPAQAEAEIRIGLNFEEIDEANINSITIKGARQFFEYWEVYLKDNRNNERVKIGHESDVTVHPPVQLNKLMRMGFTEGSVERDRHYFELIISRVHH